MGDARTRLRELFDLPRLDLDASSVAAVDAAGVIIWVNAAWHRFGAENGADPATIAPGVRYVEAIQGELREWFETMAEGCIADGAPFECDYECSSPSVRRHFRMRVLPVHGVGLLISHQLRVETPHVAAGPGEPSADLYRSADGVVVMCSNCRHVRRADRSAWDWVPAWLNAPPLRVSHGTCALCLDFYWRPAVRARAARKRR